MGKSVETYDWAVIGDGISGIAAVGRLLDEGAAPRRLAWVGPEFKVGDMGSKWSQVSSNTPAGRFVDVLRGYRSFAYTNPGANFTIDTLDPKGPCKLQYLVEPMQWITNRLMEQVVPIESFALGLQRQGGEWDVKLSNGSITAKRVVLAIGSEPASLDYPTPAIRLEDALDVEKLTRVFNPHDPIGVFGGSHSAIYVIHNLLELGAESIVNFYRSPLRYAIDHGDWVEWNNTGLKQQAAGWAREYGRNPPASLRRVLSTPENIERELPRLKRVVYCIGFRPRLIQINGKKHAKYDYKTGKLEEGLFGCGIGFPEEIVDPAGNVEFNVGFTKLDKYLRRVVPEVWMNGQPIEQ